MVVYTFLHIIGSEISNFNKFVNRSDVKAFIEAYSKCKISDKGHIYVTTVNLKIIRNNKSFLKGPQYKEHRHSGINDVNSEVLGINGCIESGCNNGLNVCNCGKEIQVYQN